jgi:hypothetical protein
MHSGRAKKKPETHADLETQLEIESNTSIVREYHKYLSGWSHAEYWVWARVAVIGSAVLIGLTLVLLPFGYQHPWNRIKTMQMVLACGWAILPPAWFAMEYFWLWPRILKTVKVTDEKTEFDYFKYGQDLMTKVWAGASALTFIVCFGKDIK